jgi:hypothetical protein
MLSIESKAKRTSLVFAAALVTLFFPGMAFAEGAGDTSTETTSAQTTGPQQPTGADGKTFHYNSETGKWENEHYVWDPVTKQTTLKDPGYSYDPATGKWNTSDWHYDVPSGTYQEVQTPAPAPPSEEATAANDGANPTGGTSSNATSSTNGASATAIANGVSSTAISGDATVSYNTLGGNATSGNSTITSNTMNLLQSGVNLGNNKPTTFVADINGDVTGDLMIDPTLFVLQPAGDTNSLGDTEIHVDQTGEIHNTIGLNAATGNATVNANTEAGNATSGSANAVANVTNVANSSISANGSFMGVINIYGNLNGDILFPPGFLESLLASNAPAMTLDLSKVQNGDLLANFKDNQQVSNNVTTYAASGNATVADNTAAGNAKTGTASTNVTIFNLSGHQVTGENSVLVFVNVLGEWVGVILDAQNGATAAALGGHANAYSVAGDTDINATNDTTITNDIDVSAVTGDAAVTNNTQAGNATSGDATASVNLLNITNSNMSLNGWFGILFINVFGSWNGSFGVDTDAGETPVDSPAPITGRGGETTTPQVFGASTSRSGSHVSTASYQTSSNDESAASEEMSKKDDAVLTTTAKDPDTTKKQSNSSAWKIVALGALVAGALLLLERLWSMRQEKGAKA